VIVVDGPSNDGTRELLSHLSDQGQVRMVEQPRLEGISAARNLGLEAAKGKVVGFIDDDATAEPGWISALLSAFSDADVAGVGGPVLSIEGRLVMGRNAVSKMGDWFDESRGEDVEGKFPVMVGCNMSFRTEVLRKAGGFDAKFRYHQDETDACLRVLSAGYRIAYAEKAAVRHEWCEGSYRRDRLLWYFKLRYLWGRNDAYLVRKNFGKSVTFSRYVGHKLMRALDRRVSPAPTAVASKAGAVPRSISLLGATFELSGSLFGWSR
jgi:GT2 family glycosyltransferase